MTAAECWWCQETTAAPVPAGFVPGDSGPGWTIHVCPPCQASRRIIPLADHPADTDGRPRVRPRTWQPIG